MPALREHAYQLAENVSFDDLTNLQTLRADPNSPQYMMEKEHILSKLKRTLPGTTTTISSMQTSTGEVTTEPGEIVAALQTHWRQCFTGQPSDEALLTNWLATLPQLRPDLAAHCGSLGAQGRDATPSSSMQPPNRTQPQPRRKNTTSRQILTEPNNRGVELDKNADSFGNRRRISLPLDEKRWRVRRRDVGNAIRTSRNSAPGPDGIPYMAWRTLGDLATDALWDVARLLEDNGAGELLAQAYHDEPESAGGHWYNKRNLVCLAKKPAGRTDTVGEYYAAEGTRSLSIVNCDNRIVANAARLRWEESFQGCPITPTRFFEEPLNHQEPLGCGRHEHGGCAEQSCRSMYPL